MNKYFVSAGHSDIDPGAVYGRFKESDLAVRLRNRIAVNLRAVGAQVFTDGDSSQNWPLAKAIHRARSVVSLGGIAIECHFNAGPPTARGVEVLAKPVKKDLAQAIAGKIAGILNSPIRGDKGFKPASESARGRLGFVEAGGLIIEAAFISNPDEMRDYLKLENEIAQAIADCLFNHVSLGNESKN